MPLPRNPEIPWNLFHEESPKNVPYLLYESALQLFNYTATFSAHSTFPITLQYLESLDALLNRKYFLQVVEKNEIQKNENLSSILFIQSICDTMSGRNAYVSEMMKFIDIDSYGHCLNNKQLPERFA